MSAGFEDTTRALERQALGTIWLVPWCVLCAAWGLWLVCARVDVYAPAKRARVEVSRMASRVSAERSGRITRLDCKLGALVAKGDVLVELDTAVEESQLAQGQAEIASLGTRLGALDAQIAVERQRRQSRVKMDQLGAERADLGLAQARGAASQTQELAQIAAQLHLARLTSRVDQVHAEGNLFRSQIELGGASVEVERLRAVHDFEDKSHLARIAELERERVDVEAERSAKRAELVTLRVRIDQSKIRAPVGGKLGSISALQVGDVVQSGSVIGTLIPEDGLRVVAEFEPGLAVGRIVPGQPAEVRLEGFSWTEYGALDASVSDVASEPDEGFIRVELQLERPPAWRIPVQHGLPGAVDVRVDRVSPLELCVRSVGAGLAGSVEAVGDADRAYRAHPSARAR